MSCDEKEGVSLTKMADKWLSAIVTRKRIGDFTGGLLNARHMANLDSKKGEEGIPSPHKFNDNRVYYFVSDVVRYIEERSVKIKK